MKNVKTVLLGLGAVNIGLLKILEAKSIVIAQTYGIQLNIVGVADSSGVAAKSTGYSYDELIALKAVGNKARDLSGYIADVKVEDIVKHVDAHLLIDGSPVNLDTGNPGLQAIKDALTNGWSVVSANKAPLVLGFDEIQTLAKNYGGKIAFSATVCGGLPVLNVMQRDLLATELYSVEGIFNATSNFILAELEKGNAFDAAVIETQRVGAAEADPALDIDGFDTANKLYIIMKSFCGYSGNISDIQIEGVRAIDQTQIRQAAQRNKRIKLLASAQKTNGQWQLSVKPVELAANSFLGQCDGWEMGISIKADYYEEIAMKIKEQDPISTCAAVLRDVINLFAS